MPRTNSLQRSKAVIPAPDKIAVTLTVNGVGTQLNLAPWTTLLDALREHLDLTGTKKGCDAITANAAPVRCWSTGDGSIPASLSQ